VKKSPGYRECRATRLGTMMTILEGSGLLRMARSSSSVASSKVYTFSVYEKLESIRSTTVILELNDLLLSLSILRATCSSVSGCCRLLYVVNFNDMSEFYLRLAPSAVFESP
jgi:hypothetical protein